MRLVFVRHGAASDVQGRCIGQTDLPLSAKGAREITALQINTTVRKIVASDLARAHESTRLLAEQLRLSVARDARLREMNFGDWDGALWSELELSDGQRLSDWMDHWRTAAPPNGETVDALAHRVAWWLDEQLVDESLSESTVIVVAHAGSIRAAICLLTGTPLDKMFEIPVEHAHATIVEVSAAGATITASNVRTVI